MENLTTQETFRAIQIDGIETKVYNLEHLEVNNFLDMLGAYQLRRSHIESIETYTGIHPDKSIRWSKAIIQILTENLEKWNKDYEQLYIKHMQLNGIM